MHERIFYHHFLLFPLPWTRQYPPFPTTPASPLLTPSAASVPAAAASSSLRSRLRLLATPPLPNPLSTPSPPLSFPRHRRHLRFPQASIAPTATSLSPHHLQRLLLAPPSPPPPHLPPLYLAATARTRSSPARCAKSFLFDAYRRNS